MHAPVEWKLYDTCGVHHVTAKDKKIFMLMEKDYPLRKGLAIRMISYKLQVENYSKMANDLILKVYKIASSPRQQDMDQQNPTLAKILILDTGKVEQWQFRIQQYLQHEHYALWEVIKFGDSYEVPANVATTGSATDETGKKKGRTVTLTTEDMQKRKNDVKARTTLLLSLPDKHQL
nr:hypothetical protein [Tanacetum cinerariifolium]